MRGWKVGVGKVEREVSDLKKEFFARVWENGKNWLKVARMSAYSDLI